MHVYMYIYNYISDISPFKIDYIYTYSPFEEGDETTREVDPGKDGTWQRNHSPEKMRPIAPSSLLRKSKQTDRQTDRQITGTCC